MPLLRHQLVHNYSAMDKVPPEICTKICGHACLDSGYTGRSLSLVSKFVHDASQPVKLQSISLQGQVQIAAFASLLQQTPPHLRRVRHLFISKDDPFPLRLGWECTKISEEGVRVATEQEVRLVSAIQSILKTVAERVEVLEVACLLHFGSKFDTTRPISLPRLKEFTTHYGFALGQAIFEPCHQLQRMHIVKPYDNNTFRGIRDIGPSLTHLRFSEANLGGLQRLEVALGIRKEYSGPNQGLPVARLPSSVQKIIVKPPAPPAPTGRCGTHAAAYEYLMTHLRYLNEKEGRFVLLKRQDDTTPLWHIDSDWLDRIVGGDGCWSFDDSDVVQKTGIVPEQEEW